MTKKNVFKGKSGIMNFFIPYISAQGKNIILYYIILKGGFNSQHTHNHVQLLNYILNRTDSLTHIHN